MHDLKLNKGLKLRVLAWVLFELRVGFGDVEMFGTAVSQDPQQVDTLNLRFRAQGLRIRG